MRRGRLLQEARRLGVAVSGGSDSVALLHLLAARWKADPRRCEAMVVLHVHHGIRGVTADEDEAFVREQAEALGLEIRGVRLDVPSEARAAGESLELVSRRLRYAQFGIWARELGLQAVVTGHTRDDQAETVLYRVLRGAGWRGLAGIPACRWLDGRAGGVRLIRPLLDWSRQDLRDFLAEHGISYREDASNSDPTIPRSYLRGTLLPLAEAHVHPGASRSLVRLGAIAREHASAVRSLARRALRKCREAPGPGGERRLRLAVLRRWPVTIAREAILLEMEAICRAASRGPPSLSFCDSQQLARWLSATGPRSGRLAVACQDGNPEPLALELRYGVLALAFDEVLAGAGGPELELVLGGEPVAWGGWELQAFLAGEAVPPVRGWIEERLDAGRVAALGRLTWRARRDGDRFWPLGAPGHKKLKEFLRERRIAPVRRSGVPLLAAGSEVVWVVGERIGHPYRVEPGIAQVLVVRARRRSGQGTAIT